MPHVYASSQHRYGWNVSFLEEDLKTPLRKHLTFADPLTCSHRALAPCSLYFPSQDVHTLAVIASVFRQEARTRTTAFSLVNPPPKARLAKEKPMKTYQGSEIRNVAVVGHAHCGKTTLIAALLHAAKMTPTQGRVEDGSAATAYDEEEVARRITMQNAIAFAEWQGIKINLVDTPGFHMFTHEARAALFPVESAIVVINAQSGVEPVTERVWRFAEEANVPRIVLVNQMDHPKAGGGGGLNALMDDLNNRWGRNCVPVQLPISDANGFHGVVDLVTMEAYTYTPGGDGRGKVSAEIPASLAADAKARHEALVELVAEGKDELMEEYFEKGTIPEEHLITALHEAIREDRIFPVLFSSGLSNMALDHLLDFIKAYTPAPTEREPLAGKTPGAAADAPAVVRKIDDSGPTGADRLQNHVRPLRRPHHLLQGHQRHRQERRHA